jgi:hypothetical protein
VGPQVERRLQLGITQGGYPWWGVDLMRIAAMLGGGGTPTMIDSNKVFAEQQLALLPTCCVFLQESSTHCLLPLNS